MPKSTPKNALSPRDLRAHRRRRTISTPTSQSTYQYDALPCHNSLRLLSLKPGKEEDPLVVDLEVVQGEDVDTRLADSYALSYVWGDPTRAESITCNMRLLKITSSLSIALQAIRKEDAEVLLWADAICINQDDPFERNHQIKLMTQIYSKAKRVLVWLGPDPDHVGAEAFQLSRRLSTDQLFAAHIVKNLAVAGKVDNHYQVMTSVMQMLFREWFHRVWTMQEIGLASRATLIWGSSQIDWVHTFRAVDLLDKRIPEIYLVLRQVRPSQVAHLYHWRSAADKFFLDILNLAAARNTTDPRDRVFALLSHPSARLKKSDEAPAELLIEADYTRSVEDVYTDVATRHIAVTKCLDVLSYVRCGQTFDIPSWVPDWSRRPDKNCLLTQHGTFASSGRGIFCHWHEYNVSSTNTEVNKDLRYSPKKAVTLCASVVGNVIWCSASLGDDVENINIPILSKAIWRYLQGALLEENPTSDSTASLIAKYRDALTCGGLYRRYSDAEGPRRHLSDFAAFWSQLWGNGPEAELVAKPDDPQRTKDRTYSFRTAWLYASKGRVMFHTDTGYVGRGPKTLSEGDEVCILQGGRVPYILRRVPSKAGEGESQTRDEWNLVGECYVSGAMYGELVEGEGIGEVQWEARTLV
jgi:hypothetical protein